MSLDNLFAQLKHPNPNLRDRAMLELAEARDESTIPRLMAILGDEDVAYRRSAVKALGAVGVDAVPALVEALLNSDNGTIRGSCAKALAQVALNHHDVVFPEMGLKALQTAMGDANPVVHLASVMALGEIGAPALEILVEELKKTENVAVAVAIVNALGSIGDLRANDILTEFANNESVDSYVRESAVSAIPRLEQVMKYREMNAARSRSQEKE